MMTSFSRHNFVWIAAIALMLGLSSCGGCGGKKRSDKSTKGGATEDPVEPKGDDGGDEGGNEEDIGERKPVPTDAVTTFNTDDAAKILLLPVDATEAQEAGRHLFEHLMIVRAKEESCVRMKVRPTGGLGDHLDTDSFTAEATGTGACAGQKIGGEDKAADTPPPESEEPAAEPAADLWLSALPNDGDDAHLRRSVGFELTATNLPICSPRLFRMLADGSGEDNQGQGQNAGLETVVSKIGRLAAKGSKVRVWVDEEFANICSGGEGLDSRPPVAFGALEQSGAISRTLDQLRQAYLNNLVAEMDAIVGDVTATFGAVSDIDKNGFVDIFMSPDVNRRYFDRLKTNKIDEFRARLVYRPEDLAYYNAETNPTSNEGEILYLWTPDPAGIYNYVQFPSANSITSNYAKGYLAAQVTTLIVANQKLFLSGVKKMEEQWLVEALAGVVASYYAGNDFAFNYLIQYLSSRPQYVSLTTAPSKDHYSDKYLPAAYDEQTGMRIMFGWYLHSKLCGGSSVAPCAKLKDLIVAKELGKKNVEKVIGLNFNQVLENFGASVGISLLEKPNAALAFWQKNPLPAGTPPAPTKMPDLTEIRPSNPPKTVEADDDADLVTGSAIDRTVAGPFPSKSMLIMQPVASDNDIEFKLAKDSVAFIIITGLVSQTTDITAVFGKGLNVVSVPAGERDTSRRRMHVEKVSEQAHSDLRPENLTPTVNANTTAAYRQVYEDLDYAVTGKRELWILGSTDNFTINKEGINEQIGDADAFTVSIMPCAHLNGAAKTTCEAADQTVLAQVVVRDFAKELAPMLVVTNPDRDLFRGHSVVGRLTEIAPDFEEDEETISFLCNAANTWPDAQVTLTAGDPGVVTWTAHPAGINGDTVYLTAATGRLPRGLSPYYPYTVVDTGANTLTLRDNGVDVSIGQSGAHRVVSAGGTISATLTIGNPTIVTATGHGLADGDPVSFRTDGALPEGLIPGRTYTVANATANTFEVAVATTDGIAGTFMIHTGDGTKCANGGVLDERVYSDRLTRLDPESYAHTYNNYLAMGRLGFPYTSVNSLSWAEGPECPDFRCYLGAEAQRQHLSFKLLKDEKVTGFAYVPAARNLYVPSGGANILDGKTVAILASIKRKIDGCETPDPQADSFIEECASVADLSESVCRTACGTSGSDIQTKIEAFIAANESAISCGLDCVDHYTLVSQGSLTRPWIPLSRFYWYGAPVGTDTYYYKPNEPTQKAGYCSGEPGDGTTRLGTCSIKTPEELSDIRHQLNVPANKLRPSGCMYRSSSNRLSQEFDVCIDSTSWQREIAPDDGYVMTYIGERLDSDRARVRTMPIASRAGELLAKPERFQYVMFKVPGTGTVANFIVGGRQQSQGKYLLRVRVKDFD